MDQMLEWAHRLTCSSTLTEDQKDVILADRFQHLSQDKRKLHKSMERKRKKVAGKEKKSMPAKRSRSDGAQ